MATEHSLTYGSTSISAQVSGDGSLNTSVQTISFNTCAGEININPGNGVGASVSQNRITLTRCSQAFRIASRSAELVTVFPCSSASATYTQTLSFDPLGATLLGASNSDAFAKLSLNGEGATLKANCANSDRSILQIGTTGSLLSSDRFVSVAAVRTNSTAVNALVCLSATGIAINSHAGIIATAANSTLKACAANMIIHSTCLDADIGTGRLHARNGLNISSPESIEANVCGSGIGIGDGINIQSDGNGYTSIRLTDSANITSQNGSVVLTSGDDNSETTLTLDRGDASLIGNGQQIKAALYDPADANMTDALFATSYESGSWTKLEGNIDGASHTYTGTPNWRVFTSVYTFNETYTLTHTDKLTFSYDVESRGAGNFILCVAISGGNKAIVTGQGAYIDHAEQLQVGTSTHVIGSEFQSGNETVTCSGYAFHTCNDSEVDVLTPAATLDGGLPLNQTSTITCSIEWNGSFWILTLTSSALPSKKITYNLGTGDIVMDKLALTMDGGQNTDDNGMTPIVRNLQVAVEAAPATALTMDRATKKMTLAAEDIELKAKDNALISACNNVLLHAAGGSAALNLQGGHTILVGGNIELRSRHDASISSTNFCLSARCLNIHASGQMGHINLRDCALTFDGLQLINNASYGAEYEDGASHLIPTVSIVHELVNMRPDNVQDRLMGSDVTIDATNCVNIVGTRTKLESTINTCISSANMHIDATNVQVLTSEHTNLTMVATAASLTSDRICLSATAGSPTAHILIDGNGNSETSSDAGYISIGAQGAVNLSGKHVHITPDCSLTLSAQSSTICLSTDSGITFTTFSDGAIDLAICATALHLTKESILLGRREIGSAMPALTLNVGDIDLVSGWERHTVDCGLIITQQQYTTVCASWGLHVEYSLNNYTDPSLYLTPGIISWKNDGNDSVVKELNLNTVKARAGQYTLIDYNSNTALAIERALVPNTLVIIPWHRVSEATAFTQPAAGNNVVGASGRIVYIPNPATPNDTLPLDNLFARDSYITVEDGALTPSIMDTQALLFKWMLLPSPVPSTGIIMLVTREAIVKRDDFATTDDNFDNA